MKQEYKISLFKKFIILFFLLLLFVSISAFSYVNAVSTSLSDSVFRLHILANSDSVEDQSLKYKVRDKVIEAMNELTSNCSSKREVINLVNDNLSNFKNIAKKVIVESGYDYDINVSIGNFNFPTKNYGDISLPAGFYDALRIEIGNAEGKNWWCVMFPPLCFVDVSTGIVPEESKILMQDELSEEEFQIISEQTPEIKFKFKLLELFSNVTNTLTAKK